MKIMSLTLSDVQKLADLARIELAEHEAQTMLAQLNRLFTLIDKVQTVSTDGVLPLAHPTELAFSIDEKAHIEVRLREDKVTEIVPSGEYQRIAPAAENDLYLVPKVIE